MRSAVHGSGQSGVYGAPSAFTYNPFKLEKLQERWPIVSSSAVDALAEATVRQLFANPASFNTIDSSSLFSESPEAENDMLAKTPLVAKSGIIPSLDQSSPGLPVTDVEAKPTEIVFRLSSKQLSNALALRNHGKSTFNNKKEFHSSPPDATNPIPVCTEDLEQVMQSKINGEVRIKRKYTKRKNRGDGFDDGEMTAGKKVRSHKCPLCPKMFSSLRAVEKHEHVHQKVKPFECRHCSGRFTRYDNLQSHMKCVHNDRLYSCKQCAEIFDSREALKEHTASHATASDVVETRAVQKVYICKQCSKIFNVHEELRKHVQMHKLTNPVKIEENWNADDKSGLLNDPIYAAYVDAELTCCGFQEQSVCAVGKFKRGRKPKHMYVPFVRDIIKQEVEMVDVSVKQERDDSSSEENVPISPPAGNKYFGFDSNNLPLVGDGTHHITRSEVGCESDTVSLNSSEYRRKINAASSEKFGCLQCHKKLVGKQALRRHMKLIHTVRLLVKFKTNHTKFVKVGQKRHGRSHCCDQCGKTFPQIFMLRRHMEHHAALTQQRYMHDCSQCSAASSSSYALNFHVEAQHGDGSRVLRTKRPFRQRTPLQKQLKYQLRLANRRRKETLLNDLAGDIKRNSRGLFQCQICELSFSMIAKLRRHMAVHTGEQLYNCEHCDQTFARLDKLRTHLRVSHDKLARSGLFCKEKFDLTVQLRAHNLKQTEHKVIIDTSELVSHVKHTEDRLCPQTGTRGTMDNVGATTNVSKL